MYEKFQEASEAAKFVSMNLTEQFPNATAEVIQVVKNQPRRAVCEVERIGSILEKACKGFPLASVDYHPDNRYGFVAEIRCHGEHGRRTTFQRHKRDRPRVLVLLTKIEGKDIVIGEHIAPASDEED